MITAIVQARTGSTRLPNKVLMDLCGKPLLWRILERISQSKHLDNIVVATTDHPDDKKVSALAMDFGAKVFEGSKDHVLDRYYQAAKKFGSDIIVRITADDPFKDPKVIDHLLERFQAEKVDYLSNTLHPTYPEGLDIEIFSFAALEKAWKEAKKPSEHEHVTPYIWNNPDIFRIKNVDHTEDISHLRWTIDYPEDMEFARAVYAKLYPIKKVFLMEDILELLKREPDLQKINQGKVRNEGYLKSLQHEQ